MKEITGRFGWKAVYIKIVDIDDNTVEFYQEIYDANNQIIETHKKFPFDLGHKKI